jgi:hypothetical protein
MAIINELKTLLSYRWFSIQSLRMMRKIRVVYREVQTKENYNRQALFSIGLPEKNSGIYPPWGTEG